MHCTKKVGSRVIQLLLTAVLAASQSLPAFATETHDFNVPAEAAADGIRDFASQARVQILAAGENVTNKQLHAVNGKYSTDQGLRILLAESGLSPQYVGDRSIALVAAPGASAPTSSDQPKEEEKSFFDRFRVAQVDQGSSAGGGGSVAPAATGESVKLEEVVVTGSYQFLSVDTSGTTNLPLPIEQVPQSISLISNDFIRAADLKTLGDIAQYTPGAINNGDQLDQSTSIKLRGFGAGRAVDGLQAAGYNFYEPDYAIYDRTEIVKGPSSVVYGVASPGGIVNYVTKRATAVTPSYLSAQYGSWSNYRLEGQGSGRLDDERIGLIGIAVQEHGESFIGVMSHSKTALYAGLDARLSDSVSAYLHAGYEHSVRTAFDGIPTEADGSLPPLPRSFFIGAGNMELSSNAYHSEAALTWAVAEGWDIALKGNYANVKTAGLGPFGGGLTPDGSFSLAIEVLKPFRDKSSGVSLSSTYHLDGFGLKNSFISAALMRQEDKTILDEGFAFGATAQLSDGEAGIAEAFNRLLADFNPSYPYYQAIDLKTNVASVQSVLQVLDRLALLLGASYSKPEETQVIQSGASPAVPQSFQFNGQVSYRAGLTYEVYPKTYAYASYSESFQPQPALDINRNPLSPISGREYEAGIKFRSPRGRGLLTAAIFQIEESNVAQHATANGVDYSIPIGQVRHRGVELEATGEISSQWQLKAGYAYLDPKISEDSNMALVGQTELFLPKQTGNLYTTYTFPTGILRGVSVGGGIRYVGAAKTSYVLSTITPTKDLPAYTLVDASLSYSYDKWLLQLNAHNIFNKYYLINNYQDLYYGNSVGAPFNVALMLQRSC